MAKYTNPQLSAQFPISEVCLNYLYVPLMGKLTGFIVFLVDPKLAYIKSKKSYQFPFCSHQLYLKKRFTKNLYENRISDLKFMNKGPKNHLNRKHLEKFIAEKIYKYEYWVSQKTSMNYFLKK